MEKSIDITSCLFIGGTVFIIMALEVARCQQ